MLVLIEPTTLKTRGERLQYLRTQKAYRDKRKIKQEDVANQLSISRSRYAGWENDNIDNIDDFYIEMLANYFESTIAYINEGIEEEKKEIEEASDHSDKDSLPNPYSIKDTNLLLKIIDDYRTKAEASEQREEELKEKVRKLEEENRKLKE